MFFIYALYAILFIIILLILGFFLEEFFLYTFAKKTNVPGKLINCSKGNFHVYSKGTGDCTVVFTSGLNSTSPYCEFYEIQDKVSKFSKSIVYERYGYGFSDATSKSNNVDDLVEDIRKSLLESGHTPPYIFIPYSTASLEVLRYAEKYPAEVKGVILNDCISPSFVEKLPKYSNVLLRINQFLKFIGINRLITKFSSKRKNLVSTSNSDSINKIHYNLYLKNIWNENMIFEIKTLSNYADTILNNKTSLNNIPLIVLTSNNCKNISKNLQDEWIKSQNNLISLSKNSKQVNLDNSNFPIHIYNQDVLLIAIQEILYNN